MKLSDKQLEELLLKSFELLDKTKETCKVTVSQCLQASDPRLTNSAVRACLETMDTAELCKLFIIDRSPNTKHCVAFTLKVLKTNINELDKIKNEKYCADMVKFCSNVLTETYKTLKEYGDNPLGIGAIVNSSLEDSADNSTNTK